MMRLMTFLVLLCAPVLASEPPPPVKIRVALEWFLNPHHAPFIIAQTNGYFADEGLDVSLQTANGSQEGCRHVMHGIADFAITHEPQVLILNAKGFALDVVAVLIPEPLEVCLSTQPLSELKGKTIAHDSAGAGSLTFAVLKQILRAQNLTDQDVTILMSKNALVAGFLAGKVDVILNVYRTYQLKDIQRHMKRPFHVYAYSDFGVPNFASMVLVCARTLPHDIRAKMQRALQRAVTDIHNNPDLAFERIKKIRSELDTPENKSAWYGIVSVFASNIKFNYENNQMKEFLLQSGLLN